MRKTITIITTITLLGSLAASAQADTCTFAPDGSSGIWNLSNNWINCGGQTPDESDTANIPGGKTCRITHATTENAKVIAVSDNGFLKIEGTGTLRLHGPGDSVISGEIWFAGAGGPSCPGNCDPLNPDPPGTLHIVNDLTITSGQPSSGLLQGRCVPTHCLNPGLISGEPGVTLTFQEAPASSLTIRNFLRFDVKLEVEDVVIFLVDLPDQVMEFDEELHGEAQFIIIDGKVQIDACMFLTGPGPAFLLAASTGADQPGMDINASVCSERPILAGSGTLNVNADFVVLPDFRLGPSSPFANGSVPVEINVAEGVTFSLPRTGGTCPPAFCD